MSKSELTQIKTLIIGLGSAGWVSDLSDQDIGKSHSFSISANQKFKLIGGVDSDSKKRDEWKKVFLLPTFADIESALSSLDYELVVIATPMNTLFPILEKLLLRDRKSRIIVEKPVLVDSKDFRYLAQLSSENGSRIIVNLPRLFSPEFTSIRSLLNGQDLISVSGDFSGSYLNTSLHLISFLNSLFPDCRWSLDNHDNQTDLQVYHRGFKIGVIEGDRESFASTFNLEITTNKGTLSYLDGGLSIKFKHENLETEIISTRKVYQKNVYDYISASGWSESIRVAGLQAILPSIASFLGLDDE